MSDLVARLENMLLIPSPEDSTPSSRDVSGMGVRDMNGMISHDEAPHHQSGEEDVDEQK